MANPMVATAACAAAVMKFAPTTERATTRNSRIICAHPLGRQRCRADEPVEQRGAVTQQEEERDQHQQEPDAEQGQHCQRARQRAQRPAPARGER